MPVVSFTAPDRSVHSPSVPAERVWFSGCTDIFLVSCKLFGERFAVLFTAGKVYRCPFICQRVIVLVKKKKKK